MNKASKPAWGVLDAQGITARSARRVARVDRRCEAAFRSILSSRAAFRRGTRTNDGAGPNRGATGSRQVQGNQDQDDQNKASQDQAGQDCQPLA